MVSIKNKLNLNADKNKIIPLNLKSNFYKNVPRKKLIGDYFMMNYHFRVTFYSHMKHTGINHGFE